MLEAQEKQRISIPFEIPEKVFFKYNGIKIEVSPYLSQSEQVAIINTYIQEYFFSNSENKIVELGKNNVFGAEYKLALSLVHYATNIDISNLNDDVLYSTSLLFDIKENISNYYDFEEVLHKIVKDVQREFDIKKQLGHVVDELSNKIVLLLEQIGTLDSKEILETGKSLIDELSKSETVKMFSEEAVKTPVKEKKKKVEK